MKKKVTFILITLLVFLVGCTPAADIESLEARVEALEAESMTAEDVEAIVSDVGLTEDEVEAIALESGVTEERVLEILDELDFATMDEAEYLVWLETRPTHYQDPNPRVYMGDEDVTPLVDEVWLSMSSEGAVTFKLVVRSDALSGEHSGPLYVIPSDDFQSKITFTAYDLFSVGGATITSGDKSPRLRSTQAQSYWYRLPENHPRGNKYGIRFTAYGFEHWAVRPDPLGIPSIMNVQGTGSRMDVPWHYHYGIYIHGSLFVFLPRLP